MKRKHISQAADAPAASAGAAANPAGPASATEIAEECARIAGECGFAAAPDAAPPAIAAEPAGQSAKDARKEPPALPRAARLPPAAAAPRAESAAPRTEAPVVTGRAAAAAAENEARPRRFALLAASIALAAALGALGGSFAVGGIGHLLAPPAPARADAAEEVRALKDSVAQLRANLKAIGDNVAAVRAGLNASFSSSTAQFAKVEQAIEKLDRHQAERHAAAPPAATETTGSVASAPAPAAKPVNPVVEGWVLRKAYRGAALVEGRYGIIEIEPGDMLPGVGRVEDIKRQDGRWVVVTARGLIVGAQ